MTTYLLASMKHLDTPVSELFIWWIHNTINRVEFGILVSYVVRFMGTVRGFRLRNC
jgi:hypothetical protein